MKNAERIELAIRAFAWVVVPDDCVSVAGHNCDDGVSKSVLRYDAEWATDEVAKAVVERLCPSVNKIDSEYEAKAFIAHVVVYHGIGAEYSPMRDFDEYMDENDGQLLDQDACETLDNLQAIMFAVLGESRPYALAIQLLYELGPLA